MLKFILLLNFLHITYTLDTPNTIRSRITDTGVVEKIKPYLYEHQYNTLLNEIKS
jgi:hypothetical protein